MLSIGTFENNAQQNFGAELDTEYAIKIGSKKITLPPNINNLDKKELVNNLYEGSYHVLVQFEEEPNVELETEMIGKVFNEIAFSKKTYIASIDAKVSKRALKKLNVRSILPLSPEMKIVSTVMQSTEETVKVNIVTPMNITKETIAEELEKYNVKFEMEFMAESVSKYTYFIEKSKLKTIAALPWVLQIEEGGM